MQPPRARPGSLLLHARLSDVALSWVGQRTLVGEAAAAALAPWTRGVMDPLSQPLALLGLPQPQLPPLGLPMQQPLKRLRLQPPPDCGALVSSGASGLALPLPPPPPLSPVTPVLAVAPPHSGLVPVGDLFGAAAAPADSGAGWGGGRRRRRFLQPAARAGVGHCRRHFRQQPAGAARGSRSAARLPARQPRRRALLQRAAPPGGRRQAGGGGAHSGGHRGRHCCWRLRAGRQGGAPAAALPADLLPGAGGESCLGCRHGGGGQVGGGGAVEQARECDPTQDASAAPSLHAPPPPPRPSSHRSTSAPAPRRRCGSGSAWRCCSALASSLARVCARGQRLQCAWRPQRFARLCPLWVPGRQPLFYPDAPLHRPSSTARSPCSHPRQPGAVRPGPDHPPGALLRPRCPSPCRPVWETGGPLHRPCRCPPLMARSSSCPRQAQAVCKAGRARVAQLLAGAGYDGCGAALAGAPSGFQQPAERDPAQLPAAADNSAALLAAALPRPSLPSPSLVAATTRGQGRRLPGGGRGRGAAAVWRRPAPPSRRGGRQRRAGARVPRRRPPAGGWVCGLVQGGGCVNSSQPPDLPACTTLDAPSPPPPSVPHPRDPDPRAAQAPARHGRRHRRHLCPRGAALAGLVIGS